MTYFVFSFSKCYLDISFFLSIILLSQFHFVARKIAVTLRQFHFLSVSELSWSETRLISTSCGIVMTFALKTKMGNKYNTNRQNTISTNGQPSAQLFFPNKHKVPRPVHISLWP